MKKRYEAVKLWKGSGLVWGILKDGEVWLTHIPMSQARACVKALNFAAKAASKIKEPT